MEAAFKHDDSRDYYEKQKAVYEEKHGPLTDAADSVLRKAAEMEHLANEAHAKVETQGLTETYWISNNRRNDRESKALQSYLKITREQTRLLAALKLLPGNRSTIGRDDEDDDGGEIDDLQDC